MNSKKCLNKRSLIIVFILVFLIAGCGPSPEQQAATAVALTAAAATDTPTPIPTSTPTLTPTPIPYDLSVLVTDGDEVPIIGATVVLAETDEDSGTQTTDDSGQVTWYNLPDEIVSLNISAQGYLPTDLSKTIERGPNEFEVVLERDPYGLLPIDACTPGEHLLYIEDFQDGAAQGWPDIEFRAQGWELGPHPDSPGNEVILNPGHNNTQITLQDYEFDNAVWRTRFMPIGMPNYIFNWHFVVAPYEVNGDSIEFSNYGIGFPYPYFRSVRATNPFPEVVLVDKTRSIEAGVWHTIEISTYNGVLEVWLDGHRALTYKDPAPLIGGPLGIELWESEDDQSIIYFDDISVCELNAPFVPIPTPEPSP